MGSVYALVAFGFSITYTTTKTFNFGQGAFLALAGLIGVSAIVFLSQGRLTGFPNPADVTWGAFLFALFAAMLVLGLLGYLLYATAIKHFVGEAGLSWVMSTIGFGIIMQSLALSLWGPGARMVAAPLGDGVLRIGGVGLRSQELLVLVLAFGILFTLDHALRRTALGRSMRAVAQNRDAAALMGIDVTRIMMLAFAVSTGLAGLSGMLIAPIMSASLFMGVVIALKGFSAAIVGGLSSPRGCMFGGLLIGLAESFTALWSAQWREIVVFVLVIAVLAVMPNGLFGRKLVEKV
jgi:branched-chain amino acid transport system permease protein